MKAAPDLQFFIQIGHRFLKLLRFLRARPFIVSHQLKRGVVGVREYSYMNFSLQGICIWIISELRNKLL